MTSVKKRAITKEKKRVPDEIIPGQNCFNGFLVKGKKKSNKKPSVKINSPRPEIAAFPETPIETISVPIDQKKKAKAKKPLYKCDICEYTNYRRYLILRHNKIHTNDRQFNCTVCSRDFKTSSALSYHTRTHFGLKPYQCVQCDGRYSTSGELLRHVRYKHTHEKPHKCPECDYASVEASKLRRHMTCHSGERPHQCPHCTYASSDTFKLKRHLRSHTGEKPYTCEICGSKFTQSNSLKSHLQVVHQKVEKPMYSCHICSSKYMRKTSLRTHMQSMHENVAMRKCNACNLTFTNKYSYRIHRNTHKGEKKYKCSSRLSASDMKRILAAQTRTHTKSKTFRCACDISFRREELLKRHKNRHHNPNYVPPNPMLKSYQCDICGAFFARKGNLIRHVGLHEVRKQKKQMKLAKCMVKKAPRNVTKDIKTDCDDSDTINDEKRLSM